MVQASTLPSSRLSRCGGPSPACHNSSRSIRTFPCILQNVWSPSFLPEVGSMPQFISSIRPGQECARTLCCKRCWFQFAILHFSALDTLPRLHRRQNPDAWERYSQEAGVLLTNPAMGARYDLHAMLIEAALAGLGVVLVPRLYVATELAQGRLVAPWPDGKTISKTFCIVLPEPLGLSGKPIQAFTQWILAEAKKTTMLEPQA